MSDAFDLLLTSHCSVLKRNGSTVNSYGIPDPGFITLATGIPCRVSLGKGRAKEFKQGQKMALNYRCVFMRAWVDTDGNPLSHEHWLLIDGIYYDCFQIDNPGNMDHHFEVWCQLVEP